MKIPSYLKKEYKRTDKLEKVLTKKFKSIEDRNFIRSLFISVEKVSKKSRKEVWKIKYNLSEDEEARIEVILKKLKKDKKSKPVNSKDLPKILKKEFKSEKQLNKKVLKKVLLPKDKDFVKNLFHYNQSSESSDNGDSFGIWKIKEDLTKEEKKELKRIFKEIKKGKGKIKKLPLTFFSIIIGAILIFAIFIKNPLAESLSEKYLGKVFGATVDIDKMRFSFLKGGFKFDRMQVADENKLDYNLFELGRSDFRFSRRAFLLKKFVINSMVCKSISWDTKREKRAKLTNGNQKKENLSTEEKVKNIAYQDKDIKKLGESIEKAKNDPEAFIEEQWRSFKSPVYAEELVKKYTKSYEDQEKSYYSIEKTSKKIIKQGNSLVYRDYSVYKNDPLKIPSLVKDIADFSIEMNTMKIKIEKEVKDIEKLERAINSDQKILRAKIDEDIKTLKNVIPTSSADIEEIFNKKIEEFLIAKFGSKYTTAKKIDYYIKKYQNREISDKELAKKKKEKIRKQKRMEFGRVVNFQSFLPDFALINAGFSSEKDENAIWDFNIKNITSDPEKWGKPIFMNVDIKTPNGSGVGDLTIDLRKQKKTKSSGGVKFSGVSLNSKDLESIGIPELNGLTKGDYRISVENLDEWKIYGDTNISKIKMSYNKDDEIAKVIYRVLSRSDWNIKLEISGKKDKDIKFKIKFGLLDKLQKEVGNMLKEESEKYFNDLKKAYLSKTSENVNPINTIENFASDLENWEKLLKGDVSSMNNIKKELNKNLADVKSSSAQDSILDTINSLF